MKTLTKEKLIEILRAQFYKEVGDLPIIWIVADEILSLHNAEIAKYKELVEAWKTFVDMQTDDFEHGLYYDNQDKRNELRQGIAELTKEIVWR